jgi:hypothetical protein
MICVSMHRVLVFHGSLREYIKLASGYHSTFLSRGMFVEFLDHRATLDLCILDAAGQIIAGYAMESSQVLFSMASIARARRSAFSAQPWPERHWWHR